MPEVQWHSRKHAFSVFLYINEEKYQQGIRWGKKKVIFLQLTLSADYNQGLQTKPFGY